MNELFKLHGRKILYGLMAVGLALSLMAASLPSAVRPASPEATPQSTPSASEACLTREVTITLASEQVVFCAPTSLPFSVVEDSSAQAAVSYAGLSQVNGFGGVNIKATAAGIAPGIGRPVYTPGDVAAYRQAVRDAETAKPDRTVSTGPGGLFWNETVPGIQVDLTLPTSNGDLVVRSIEWYVEHGDRLWSFSMAWDTGLANAGDWQAASLNFSVQTPEGTAPADTAVDLARLQPESRTAGTDIFPNGAPVDVGTPSWWDGTCDTNNYYPATGIHSTRLYRWHGVSACGPVPTTPFLVHYYAGAVGQYEFDAVELVMRFLYLEWNIAPWAGNGNTIKDTLPGSMVFYPNDGTHKIVPGDVLTENPSVQNSKGHAMVVTSLSVDATGTGTVSFMEQNLSTAGTRALVVTNWQVQADTVAWGQTIQGWLHFKSNQDDGDFDLSFTPGTGSNGRINAISVKVNGKIMIAGNFTGYDGKTINRVARLNTDGTLDTGYVPVGVGMTGDTPHVNTLVIYPADLVYAGEFMIGGHFDTYNAESRRYIARVKSDGSLDGTFVDAAVVDNDVYAIALQTDGKILAGGTGTLRRMTPAGKADPDFHGTMNGDVYAIIVQADGRIIIAGNFSKVDSVARAGIARLNSDGTLDATFDPGTGTGANTIKSMSMDADGKIYIAGDFTTFNGTLRNKIARLNNNGSLDTTFDPGTGLTRAADYLNVVLAESDGRVLIGGEFSIYNGTTVSDLLRLHHDGSRDASFYPNIAGTVHALALQADGKILLSGTFTDRIARLLNRIDTCYTLTATVSPSAGGSIALDPPPNCPGGKYLSGTQVKVTVALNSNYSLFNWSGDASGSDNPLSLTMNANKTVTANLMAPPGDFVKFAPADTSTGQPAGLTFLWGTSSNAASYEYCLDTTGNDSCDSGTWVSTGTNTSVFLGNLLPSVTYFWQVRARNAIATTNAGPWWSFTRNGTPAVPVTISPNGLVITNRPPFAWNVSNGASSYHLQVVNVNAPATFLVDTNVNSSACTGGICTYTSTVALPLGNYEFRVSASEAGTSIYSAWRTFTVGAGAYLPLIFR